MFDPGGSLEELRSGVRDWCATHRSEGLAGAATGRQPPGARRVPAVVGRRAARGRTPRAALAEGMGRRLLDPGAGRHRRGARPGVRPAQRAVPRRDLQRGPDAGAQRDCRATRAVHARDLERRSVVPGLLRAQRRLRSRRPPDPRGARRRQLRRERSEDLDELGERGRLVHAARAHRHRGQAQGDQLPHRRHAVDGHRGTTDQAGVGSCRLQRGLLRRRDRARRQPHWRAERRMGGRAGHALRRTRGLDPRNDRAAALQRHRGRGRAGRDVAARRRANGPLRQCSPRDARGVLRRGARAAAHAQRDDRRHPARRGREWRRRRSSRCSTPSCCTS